MTRAPFFRLAPRAAFICQNSCKASTGFTSNVKNTSFSLCCCFDHCDYLLVSCWRQSHRRTWFKSKWWQGTLVLSARNGFFIFWSKWLSLMIYSLSTCSLTHKYESGWYSRQPPSQQKSAAVIPFRILCKQIFCTGSQRSFPPKKIIPKRERGFFPTDPRLPINRLRQLFKERTTHCFTRSQHPTVSPPMCRKILDISKGRRFTHLKIWNLIHVSHPCRFNI